jgi:hypothetical protein
MLSPSRPLSLTRTRVVVVQEPRFLLPLLLPLFLLFGRATLSFEGRRVRRLRVVRGPVASPRVI